MAPASLDFNALDLVERIEALSQFDLDRLSFGAILLDPDGTVMFYSETEARQSGYGRSLIGQNFFAVCTRLAGDDFRGRIMRAREAGDVDLEFGWVGDYEDPRREMRIRVLAARGSRIWIFVERDGARSR